MADAADEVGAAAVLVVELVWALERAAAGLDVVAVGSLQQSGGVPGTLTVAETKVPVWSVSSAALSVWPQGKEMVKVKTRLELLVELVFIWTTTLELAGTGMFPVFSAFPTL